MNRELAQYRQEFSYFKQISAMGLPFLIVLPELFESLRRLLAFSSGTFVELDPDLTPIYQYVDWKGGARLQSADDLREVMQNVRSGQHAGYEGAAMQSSSISGDLASVLNDKGSGDLRRTCRTLLLKLNSPADQGRLAILLLTRNREDLEFRLEHFRRLKDLAPFLSRALTATTQDVAPWVESGDQAMVILDDKGAIKQISAGGHQLIQYALDRRRAPGRRWTPFNPDSLGEALWAFLTLARDTTTVSPIDSAPGRHWSNRWGRFELRSRRLESMGLGGRPDVAVTVIRHVPLPLKLANVLRRFPLSGSEYAVCLKIALGYSFKEIANELRLSLSTVVAHSQAIYDKLGIAGRNELLPSLYCH